MYAWRLGRAEEAKVWVPLCPRISDMSIAEQWQRLAFVNMRKSPACLHGLVKV